MSWQKTFRAAPPVRVAGDCFELVDSNELQLPDGKHFCSYALQSVPPLLGW